MSLRICVIYIFHFSPISGHPGQTRMYQRISRVYYWPQMLADLKNTIRECISCAKNRVWLIKKPHPMQLFPASCPPESVAVDILGSIPKIQRGYRFILVILKPFHKTHLSGSPPPHFRLRYRSVIHIALDIQIRLPKYISHLQWPPILSTVLPKSMRDPRGHELFHNNIPYAIQRTGRTIQQTTPQNSPMSRKLKPGGMVSLRLRPVLRVKPGRSPVNRHSTLRPLLEPSSP